MRRVHVVILTAITLEFDAALEVSAGAWPGSQWERVDGPNRLPVAFRTFRGKGGRPLRVAVGLAANMAGVAAANALLPLVEAYQPRCISMCGVCAGHPGKTNLGDVIAPDRLYFHDLGKREPDGVKKDLQTYNLREDWKLALEGFDAVGRFRNEEWWLKRPVPYEWQENWVLAKLHQGVEDPASDPECKVYCPDWEKVIELLWKSRHVKKGTRDITEKGRKRIDKLLIKHRNRLPDISPAGEVLPFKVHVAPMSSGNQVIEDKAIWNSLAESVRKTVGLEMEAATIGAIAHAQRDKRLEFLVMKGVMDFANQGRDDNFKKFAARASAECLLAFLREEFDLETIPGVDDLLVPGTAELPENPPPSALLNALYEVIPFHEQGRETILAELTRWSEEGPPTAVRLIHAEGGVGKTRLAIEWIYRRKVQGWAAGFLPKVVPENWFERLWACGQRVLIVIDYAESHTELRALLLRVLSYAQQEGVVSPRRVRLLLLARNAGAWWLSLRQSDAALGAWLGTTTPYELEPLAPEVAERDKVFHEAAEHFANKRGREYQRLPSVPLADARFRRVLYIHMAALASVESLNFAAHTLMDVVLDHEERFWEQRAELDDVKRSFQKSMARQMVVAATLRGGLVDVETAARVMEQLLGRNTLTADEQILLRLIHRIYQRQGKGSSLFLPALEPDLLGEGMVLRAASPAQEEERLPFDWIERVFPPTEEAGVVSTGFEVLGRASAMSPEVVRPWIERLLAGSLRQRARIAFVAAKAVGLRTAFSTLGDVLAAQLEARGDARLALELEAMDLPEATVSLRKVAEWVSRTLLHALRRSEEEVVLAERARHQHNLGARLSELGRRQEALTAVQEAVEAYRALAQRSPEAFQPQLAASLSNLGGRLSELGRREEALAAEQEAVALRRALAQENPNEFQHDLAMSLNNLATMLSDLGQREEALAAAQESVEAYRALVGKKPEALQSYLAVSLSNLGAMLFELGRREEALAAAREAVELRRVLAQRNPDAFQPGLAGSLNSLGAMLSALGLNEEALAATQESVELRRALTQRNPEAFQPGLAGSLNNLGAMLSELGRTEKALKITQEATEAYRALARRNPEAFQPHLAMSLNNLGGRLSELGRREEALTIVREAVEAYRALAQRNREAFQPYLAGSLGNLGGLLGELGQREEALVAVQEAVHAYHSLAQRNPEAIQPDLAMSLNNLGGRLSELGRKEEALAAAQEAVQAYRPLAQRNPEAFLPGLALSLNTLAGLLSELGRGEEALAVAQETVQAYRALARRNPEAFQHYLAASLNNQGTILRRLEQREEALTYTQEAVALRRVLAQRNPEAFQPDLAGSLSNLGTVLTETGRGEEALAAAQEAVQAYRELAQRNPEAFQPYLATSLNNLGWLLSELGRREDALVAAEEALANIWPYFKRHPHAFRRQVAVMSRRLREDYEALQLPLPPLLLEQLEELIRLAGPDPEQG